MSDELEKLDNTILEQLIPDVKLEIEEINVENDSNDCTSAESSTVMNKPQKYVNGVKVEPEDDPQWRRTCEVTIKVEDIEKEEKDPLIELNSVRSPREHFIDDSPLQGSGQSMPVDSCRSGMATKMSRKRGANYTEEEKFFLLDLIRQYKHIVDNKATGGMILRLKKETWRTITAKYNSLCTSGKRDVDQLKSLYDNMKQKTRKDIIGESNTPSSKANGGLKSNFTYTEAQKVALMQDLAKPFSETPDTATVFCKDAVDIRNEQNISFAPNSCESSQPAPENNFTFHIISQESQSSEDLAHKQADMRTEHDNPFASITCGSARAAAENGTAQDSQSYKDTLHSQTARSEKVFNQKKSKNVTAERLKRLYFKKKCRNADLERRRILLELIHSKREHNLRMRILKFKTSALNTE